MRKVVLSLIASLIIVLPSCRKDAPPALPPAETMVMDFKSFGGGEAIAKDMIMKSALATDSLALDSTLMLNFIYSKGVVDFWNIIVFLTLWTPVASYYAALKHNDWEEIDDDTWQWKFDYNVFGGVFHAKLIGKSQSDGFHWEMYISKDGFLGFNNVKWYEGAMSKDGSKGDWILYEGPWNPTKFLKVEWEKSGSKVGKIKYTYIKESDFLGNPNKYFNNYIEYGTTATAPYDRYYATLIYDVFSASNASVNIEWNQSTYEGRVKSLKKYKDELWHAWDTAGIDK